MYELGVDDFLVVIWSAYGCRWIHRIMC